MYSASSSESSSIFWQLFLVIMGAREIRAAVIVVRVSVSATFFQLVFKYIFLSRFTC